MKPDIASPSGVCEYQILTILQICDNVMMKYKLDGNISKI